MDNEMIRIFFVLLAMLLASEVYAREPYELPPRSTTAQKMVRARDLGVPFEGLSLIHI